jgi:hypothetical protein
VAEIGGYLSIHHVIIFCEVFPRFSGVFSTNSGTLNLAMLFAVPMFDWSILVFSLLAMAKVIWWPSQGSGDA